jgi:hypothetical protein
MVDQVLKKAMERRDEALREVERWENWIKEYAELAEPLEPLDIPMPGAVSPQPAPADIASALCQPDPPAKGSESKVSWLRKGNSD